MNKAGESDHLQQITLVCGWLVRGCSSQKPGWKLT